MSKTEVTALHGGPEQLPDNLRIADLATFLVVQRHRSITGAARELRVTASQVSKAMARLEEQLHLVLLRRSVRGVALTDEALRILPDVSQVVGGFRHMLGDRLAPRRLAVAGPSYMMSLFLPVIAEAQPQLRVRGIELPPAMLRARMAANFFELALLLGEDKLPESWAVVEVGEVRKGLLARPQLAARLGRAPLRPEALREVPFISPVCIVDDEFVRVGDDCPLDVGARRAGHEAPTLQVALELATRVDQLVFGPIAAARRLIAAGRLVEVEVQGWRISDTLHLAYHSQRLRARELKVILAALKSALAELA